MSGAAILMMMLAILVLWGGLTLAVRNLVRFKGEEPEEILGAGVPQAAPAVFHYVGGRVEAEVFLPFDWCADAERLAALNARGVSRVVASSHWGRIALMCRIAP